MKLGEWRDTTIHKQSDRERKPSCWTIYLTKEVSITVLLGHIYHKGEWVMHAEPWFDTYPMAIYPTTSPEVAQRMALGMVALKVAELNAAIRALDA